MSYQIATVHADGKSLYHNGNYCGIDRVFDPRIEKFVKPDFTHIIGAAEKYGFSPLLVSGTRTLEVHECPRCKDKHGMIKLVKKPDLRNRVHACKECGYRKMTPGYIATNGPFLIT
jgi:hypothetical protein